MRKKEKNCGRRFFQTFEVWGAPLCSSCCGCWRVAGAVLGGLVVMGRGHTHTHPPAGQEHRTSLWGLGSLCGTLVMPDVVRLCRAPPRDRSAATPTTPPECWRGSHSSAKNSQMGSPPQKTMKILFILVLQVFGIPGERQSWQEPCPRSPGLEHPAPREPSDLGNTKPPSHWDKQGIKISCVDYCSGLTTSGKMNPVCSSAPCPAVTQHWSLSWEMMGLCRVPKQTCSHWLFSAFAVFVLRQERGNVRSQGLLRRHMIYAFSFGCVFLLGHLQFAPRNMNF